MGLVTAFPPHPRLAFCLLLDLVSSGIMSEIFFICLIFSPHSSPPSFHPAPRLLCKITRGVWCYGDDASGVGCSSLPQIFVQNRNETTGRSLQEMKEGWTDNRSRLCFPRLPVSSCYKHLNVSSLCLRNVAESLLLAQHSEDWISGRGVFSGRKFQPEVMGNAGRVYGSAHL